MKESKFGAGPPSRRSAIAKVTRNCYYRLLTLTLTSITTPNFRDGERLQWRTVTRNSWGLGMLSGVFELHLQIWCSASGSGIRDCSNFSNCVLKESLPANNSLQKVRYPHRVASAKEVMRSSLFVYSFICLFVCVSRITQKATDGSGRKVYGKGTN